MSYIETMRNSFTIRDKAILTGLFLSKYNDEALKVLGFDSTKQAFNTLGYSLGTKPASIKNYRDEFDPYFPNNRKGWHKRQLREYCKKILDAFGRLGLNDFTELIKTILITNYELEQFIDIIEKKDYSETVAKRLITGTAAEEYFKSNFKNLADFTNYELTDTTKLACGFDYKLTNNLNYYCIEVKGLNTSSGNILLTEKEFSVAQNLKDRYCLFIVSNFIERPVHQYIFNPLSSKLTFKKMERPIIQISYNAQI